MHGPTVEEIQAFFFETMLSSWVGCGTKIEIPGMPGHWGFDYSEGDLRLVDRYCVTPSSTMSAGTTTIWYCNIPIWVMQYAGFYTDPHVISFLKRALLKAYSAGEFIGGRGPRIYVEHPFVYVNRPTSNDFGQFAGREDIYDLVDGEPSHTESVDSIGFHRYMGISLF